MFKELFGLGLENVFTQSNINHILHRETRTMDFKSLLLIILLLRLLLLIIIITIKKPEQWISVVGMGGRSRSWASEWTILLFYSHLKAVVEIVKGYIFKLTNASYIV